MNEARKLHPKLSRTAHTRCVNPLRLGIEGGCTYNTRAAGCAWSGDCDGAAPAPTKTPSFMIQTRRGARADLCRSASDETITFRELRSRDADSRAWTACWSVVAGTTLSRVRLLLPAPVVVSSSVPRFSSMLSLPWARAPLVSSTVLTVASACGERRKCARPPLVSGGSSSPSGARHLRHATATARGGGSRSAAAASWTSVWWWW